MAETQAGRERLCIDEIGGLCPVQADGTFDGVPFYFRARGQRWRLGVGADPVGVAMGAVEGFRRAEPWGEEMYDAGYMPVEVARSFIERCYSEYRAATTEKRDGR